MDGRDETPGDTAAAAHVQALHHQQGAEGRGIRVDGSLLRGDDGVWGHLLVPWAGQGGVQGRREAAAVGAGEGEERLRRLSGAAVHPPGHQEILEATKNSDGKCLLAKVQVGTLLETGAGLQNNNGHLLEFTGYPVVGNHSDLQSSGSCLTGMEDSLLTACGWDRRVGGFVYFHTTFSIPLQSFADFVADVKKLRELRPNSLCGLDLNGGFLIRFIRNSTAYLGKTADVVDIDMTYYRSRDPGEPRLDQDVLEEVEQMALFKYGGMPQWGKNRHVGFLGVKDKYGARRDLFVAAMEKYDAQGLFSSDWTDAVLGLRGKSLVVDRKAWSAVVAFRSCRV